jgi:hypothetical protein
MVPRVQAQDLVWDVSRQCWRPTDETACGQSYNVGTRHYQGEADARPTAPSSGEGGGATGAESGDGLQPDPAGNASVESLEQVRKRAEQLKGLGETSGDLLRQLGILSDTGTGAAREGGS